MRLVRQVSLYFKENNSDKVYEIDLCSVGNNSYVVNFRYGRRGTLLKEGTKTPDPVSLYKAEEIFASLESEKRTKGYQSLGDTTSSQQSIPLPADQVKPKMDPEQLPPGRKRAILQRLKVAVEGKTTARFHWETSRVIWMAGVMKMEEAVDYILLLANKGDLMQQYAAVWALGRCNSAQAIPFFLSCFKAGKPTLQRIAAAALLKVTTGKEKEKQLQFHLHSLAEPFQSAIKNKDASALKDLLQERVLAQVNPHYNFLEDLYLLSQEYTWIRKTLKELLLALPLKPNYFKHVRHIFKLAEFFDDFEFAGLLAHRFEKEKELFKVSGSAYSEDNEVFVPELSEYVDVKKELSKRNSKLAYSNRTKLYMIRRVLRSLNNYGENGDLNYVRLATALLLAYDKESDYKAPYTTYDYVWRKGSYERVENKFPANADAVFLNQVLFGNSSRYQLLKNHIWMTVDPAITNPGNSSSVNSNRAGNATPGNNFGNEGFLKKLLNFFSVKKPAPAPQKSIYANTPVENAGMPQRPSLPKEETPFLSLWNSLPQAYVQLLMHGRMEEIHQFALANLQKHPDYHQLKEKLDAAAIEQLLLSEFSVPAEFAFELALERYQPANPDTQLVKAMLYGKLEKAQRQAMEWVEASKDTFLYDPSFVSAVLLSPNANCQDWIAQKISGIVYTQDMAKDITNRVLMHIISFGDNTPVTNSKVQQAGAILVRYFNSALQSIPMQVVEHLIRSKVAAIQAIGVDILLLQKENINLDELSNDIFFTIIDNSFAPLRMKGIDLLDTLSTAELLKRQELIMHACTGSFRDVRNGIRPLVKRMAAQDHSFGINAAEWLLPFLMRKEKTEGVHEDVAAILQNELIGYINGVNKEMALRLLYSSFIPAEQFGIALIEKYIDPNELTIRQIIALGNHETLMLREWAWRYFENNLSRIRYEREDAIRLLDAEWEDTRTFAKEFFRKKFEEGDWTPKLLVGLADSVRPDIEAYGRELITRFFREEQGEEYLTRLSQHPSEKMQLFATNYLERFAASDLEKLQSLTFYFRSVLTRVNKARIAKNRIFRFLSEEGKKSEAAATFVADLISQVSATVSIEDKAKCIDILLQLQSLYDVRTPLIRKQVEEKIK
jgi:hypothetical protein